MFDRQHGSGKDSCRIVQNGEKDRFKGDWGRGAGNRQRPRSRARNISRLPGRYCQQYGDDDKPAHFGLAGKPAL